MRAVFLDIETTGLDFRKHNVLEIACKVFDISTGQEKGSYQTIVSQPLEVWQNKDPFSIEINGFKWEDLAQGKTIEVIKEEIIRFFTSMRIVRGKAVFICQNPGFDRSFFSQLVDVYTQEKLNWPYHWLDLASMYWALRYKDTVASGLRFPEEITLSKNEIAKYYQLGEEGHPHRAMNGVNHLLLCYKAVVGLPTVGSS